MSCRASDVLICHQRHEHPSVGFWPVLLLIDFRPLVISVRLRFVGMWKINEGQSKYNELTIVKQVYSLKHRSRDEASN